MSSNSVKDTRIVMGNKRELKQKTAELLISFMDMFTEEKFMIDITYEDIQDKIFKLKTKEKDMITDRLKALTDEERDIAENFLGQINFTVLRDGRLFVNCGWKDSNDDTAEIYQGSELDTERGNLLIPDNFGFIFISSKPRVIANNADFFNRVDIVILKSYEEETIETSEQLLANKLNDEDKMKLASTRNE
jgi:hypothetical protein